MTFRTISNLTRGLGFCYNVGEYVYSSTTAGFVLAMAAVCAVTGQAPHQVYLLFNTFCETAAILFFFLAALELGLGKWRSLFVSAALSLSWTFVISSRIGMETPFFVLAAVVAVYLTAGRKSAIRLFGAGIAAGVCAITRPEGLLFAALLLAFRFLCERPRDFLAAAAGCALVILPWFSFAYLYFGTLLPQSFAAKQVAYRPFPGYAVSALTQHLAQLFLAPLSFASTVALAAVLLLALCLVGLFSSIKGRSAAAPLISFSLLCFAAYGFANPLVFPWYPGILEPGYILGVVFGWLSLLKFMPAVFRLARGLNMALAAVVLAGLLFQFDAFAPLGLNYSDTANRRWLSANEDQAAHGLTRWATATGNREVLYMQIGEMINAESGGKAAILASEFGALGYLNEMRIVSSIGQVNPEITATLAALHEEQPLGPPFNYILAPIIKQVRPDYIVAPNVFFPPGLLADPWFTETFTLVRAYRSDVWGSNSILVYRSRR